MSTHPERTTARPEAAGIRAYARARSVTPAAIRKLIAAGTIPTDASGRVLVAEADAALAAGTISGRNVSPTLAEVRRRKLAASVAMLDDELKALRDETATGDEVTACWRDACRRIGPEVVRILELVPDLAGLMPGQIGLKLRDAIDATLNRLVILGAPEEDDTPEAEPAVDLLKLTAVELATRRADLQAEKMELKRAIIRGDLVAIDDAARGWQDRIATSRSRLLAIPNRCVPFFELGAKRGAEALVDELRRALEELAGAGVTAAEFMPKALAETKPRKAKAEVDAKR